VQVEFKQSFLKDLKKIKDPDLKRRIRETIEQIEAAESPREIAHLKKLHGSRGYFRIAIGHHRLGVKMDGEQMLMVRCLSRKDIDKRFP